MCLAKVFLKGKGAEELVSEDVAVIHVENGSMTVRTLFGDEKVIRGRISEIDFARSRITLEGGA